MGIYQLVQLYICFLNVINSSLINLKTTRNLHKSIPQLVCNVSQTLHEAYMKVYLISCPTNITEQVCNVLTLIGIPQLVRPYICSLKVTSSSLTNLRAIEGLHSH